MARVIGSGFLGKAFLKKKIKKKIVFFTSGVSNSLCTDTKEFNREKKKLLNFNLKRNETLIYFSTCGIFDPTRNKKKYFKHKIKVEKLIKKKFKKFLILRLPELIGKSNNRKTLINYLYNNLLLNKKIYLFKNSKRNLIHINEVVTITNYLIKNKIENQIINIANTRFVSPLYIVKILEKILKKKANFEIIAISKKNWNINLNKIKKIIPIYKKIFEKNYIEKSLRKNFK